MSASSVRELNRAISVGSLDPVYLLHGEDEFLKEAKVKRLIDIALAGAERDFNLDVLRGGEIAPEALDSILATPALFASRRVVVIRDIAALRKQAREVLTRYLTSPAPDVLLLLVLEGPLAKSDKELSTTCTTVEFMRLTGSDLEKWVRHHAHEALGTEIDAAAVRLLIDSAGNDLSLLASELDKLASYASSGTIDQEAVEELVGVRRGETVAELLDAVAMRNVGRAVQLAGPVLSQPRSSAVAVVLALTAQMMGIAYARSLLNEGQARGRISNELFSLLGSARAATARPWGEAVKVWMQAADKWTLPELVAACDALLRADISLKETRASSDEQVLISLLLELTTPRALTSVTSGI